MIRDQLGLYRRLAGAQIRSGFQYRTSFAVLTLAQAAGTGLEFIAIVFILELVPDLGGWSRPEVAFLYGLATVPFTVANALVGPIDRVARHVQAGTFDRFLLRPTPALVQLCALEFELRRFGRLLPTGAVLVWGLRSADVAWTPTAIALLPVALVCGTVIYSALWVLTSSLSFWAVAVNEATNAFTYGGEFANQYPLHVYEPWVRAVLGWGFTLAFVAYVPSIHLLGAENPLGLPPWFVVLIVPAAAAITAVALGAWALGIRHYQSTGS